MQIYLVGGAVRDALLGGKAYDRDWVVVGATPQEMLDLGYQQVGKDFPVFLHPKNKEEFALARTERKAGVGYHGFEVFADPGVTLEEDLIRRDLTINAMAQDADGQIIDPYAGLVDLENRILRHVSGAFSEDPLRVLRVARFAAKLASYNFTLAPETEALMAQMVASGELSDLTPERVWQEVVKALSTEKPSVFFEVLDKVGAVELLFPELYALHDVTQPEKYHPEGDVWIHTMMVLDAAAGLSSSIDVRFAALVHDLGKGLTPKDLWPSHRGHEAAGVPLVKKLSKRYRLPKKTQILAEKVTEFHGLIHQGLTAEGLPYLKPKTYLKVLKACSALKNADNFQQVLLACKADAKGRLGFEDVAYPQFDFWLKVLDVANQVDNQAIIATGVQGPDIALAIEESRIELIKAFIHTYSQ
ncbi:multifunctional CCA addition/repair protein [Thiomicrorhabdus lithotrophica]|uniref:CCA-adding enzyme n=1 Tax=Thiomicrorhabdus lithotrophica TaxID=2949997 RepID=A0ABY8CEK1_9GAMM|nr:multifunctional CCA addition/repair protein [Thiomicrorhabdus lithotrophica]WEJ62941.1 multifunctional CCA addition/repair protein [Thiomicrorhabdus lithotrophica]